MPCPQFGGLVVTRLNRGRSSSACAWVPLSEVQVLAAIFTVQSHPTNTLLILCLKKRGIRGGGIEAPPLAAQLPATKDKTAEAKA